MEQAFTKSVEEVLEHFSVKEAEGLSADEVEKQREKFGHNGGQFPLSFSGGGLPLVDYCTCGGR